MPVVKTPSKKNAPKSVVGIQHTFRKALSSDGHRKIAPPTNSDIYNSRSGKAGK